MCWGGGAQMGHAVLEVSVANKGQSSPFWEICRFVPGAENPTLLFPTSCLCPCGSGCRLLLTQKTPAPVSETQPSRGMTFRPYIRPCSSSTPTTINFLLPTPTSLTKSLLLPPHHLESPAQLLPIGLCFVFCLCHKQPRPQAAREGMVHAVGQSFSTL